MCEWRMMYLERSSWEKHRERLAAEAKLFEQAKAQLAREKEAFEQEKRSEEWGLQGLKKKLHASKDTLTEERRKWRVACDNDNKKMYAACNENTNLKVCGASLTKSESDYKENYEEAKSHRERVEVLQVELSNQIISKDKDLADKDVEIAELKRRLREAQESLEAEKQKSDSMEINLAVEKVKVETVEEARKVSLAALNVAQENYAEVQSTVEPLISDLGWMQHYGVTHITNLILNAIELDRVVAALTMAVRAAGHRAGYVECASHVEEALHQHFGTRHCSVGEGANEGLNKAEETYNNIVLPFMDLVTEAIKYDDYVARLRSIFESPETVQLTDDDDEDGDDEGAE
ncbi:hypothetical protein HanPI659440_Chr06g0238911 [Helianthus annuus]|nr:hypothetical protein HanPI659440_Chr06g0238911 [Helianthus annuus]